MKKTLLTALLCAGLGTMGALTSCSDDDDNPIINNPGGEITTPDNQKVVVTSIAGHKMLYTNEGSFAGIDNEFKIDYTTNTITGIGDEADPDEVMNFTYDASGRVTSLKYVDVESDTKYKEEINYKFVYDPMGHLIKVTSDGAGSEVDEGIAISWTSAMNMDLEWNGADLVTATAEFNLVENGVAQKETYKYTFTSGDNNPLSQMSAGYAIIFGEFDDEEFAWMALGGMLGTAPAHFPKQVALEYNDDDGNHSMNYGFEYDFNDNLTIHTERINQRPLAYGYGAVGSKVSKTKLFQQLRKTEAL